jgi:hypothetical protein
MVICFGFEKIRLVLFDGLDVEVCGHRWKSLSLIEIIGNNLEPIAIQSAANCRSIIYHDGVCVNIDNIVNLTYR